MRHQRPGAQNQTSPANLKLIGIVACLILLFGLLISFKAKSKSEQTERVPEVPESPRYYLSDLELSELIEHGFKPLEEQPGSCLKIDMQSLSGYIAHYQSLLNNMKEFTQAQEKILDVQDQLMVLQKKLEACRLSEDHLSKLQKDQLSTFDEKNKADIQLIQGNKQREELKILEDKKQSSSDLIKQFRIQAETISAKLKQQPDIDDGFLEEIRILEEEKSRLLNQRDYLRNYRDNDDRDKIIKDQQYAKGLSMNRADFLRELRQQRDEILKQRSELELDTKRQGIDIPEDADKTHFELLYMIESQIKHWEEFEKKSSEDLKSGLKPKIDESTYKQLEIIEEQLRENSRQLSDANYKKNKYYEKRKDDLKKSQLENSIKSEEKYIRDLDQQIQAIRSLLPGQIQPSNIDSDLRNIQQEMLNKRQSQQECIKIRSDINRLQMDGQTISQQGVKSCRNMAYNKNFILTFFEKLK